MLYLSRLLFTVIIYKLNNYFLQRREDGESMTSMLAPKMRREITADMETVWRHIVHQFGLINFEVNTGDFSYNIMNGIDAECDCSEFQLTEIHCSHLLDVYSTSQRRIDSYFLFPLVQC